MSTFMPSIFRRLIVCVVLYMVIALIGGVLAITENLPAEFGGSSTGLSVTQDFLYGMGTAISPPFYTLLIQLALLLLTPRRDEWGTVGVLGLSLIGLMTFIGALGEPINRRIFNPATFDLLKAMIMTGLIVLSLIITVVGIRELFARLNIGKRSGAI